LAWWVVSLSLCFAITAFYPLVFGAMLHADVVVVVFGLLLACVDGGGWIFAGGDWAICDGTLFFGVGVDREKALFLKRHTYTHTHPRIYIGEKDGVIVEQ
jgi:hypothetical protein